MPQDKALNRSESGFVMQDCTESNLNGNVKVKQSKYFLCTCKQASMQIDKKKSYSLVLLEISLALMRQKFVLNVVV